jgi:hypothetical protein
MKNMILAAVAVLGLTAAVIPAANARSTVADDAGATRSQQTGSFNQ